MPEEAEEEAARWSGSVLKRGQLGHPARPHGCSSQAPVLLQLPYLMGILLAITSHAILP